MRAIECQQMHSMSCFGVVGERDEAREYLKYEKHGKKRLYPFHHTGKKRTVMEIQERHKFLLGLNIELLKLGWHQSGVSRVFWAREMESGKCFCGATI